MDKTLIEALFDTKPRDYVFYIHQAEVIFDFVSLHVGGGIDMGSCHDDFLM
jgi:hypothetical protein